MSLVVAETPLILATGNLAASCTDLGKSARNAIGNLLRRFITVGEIESATTDRNTELEGLVVLRQRSSSDTHGQSQSGECLCEQHDDT